MKLKKKISEDNQLTLQKKTKYFEGNMLNTETKKIYKFGIENVALKYVILKWKNVYFQQKKLIIMTIIHKI